MIDTEKRYNPNWWDYSFCFELDFVEPFPFPRLGVVYERPFNATNFLIAMEQCARHYNLQGGSDDLVKIISAKGNLRLRPAPLWNTHAWDYKGDIYDCPEIRDPFTKFPFGPLTVKM